MSNWTDVSFLCDEPNCWLGAEGREASSQPRKSLRQSFSWRTQKPFPEGIPPSSFPKPVALPHPVHPVPPCSLRRSSCLASVWAAGYLPRAHCLHMSSVHPPLRIWQQTKTPFWSSAKLGVLLVVYVFSSVMF